MGQDFLVNRDVPTYQRVQLKFISFIFHFFFQKPTIIRTVAIQEILSVVLRVDIIMPFSLMLYDRASSWSLQLLLLYRRCKHILQSRHQTYPTRTPEVRMH